MVWRSPISGPISGCHMEQVPRPSISRSRKTADRGYWPVGFGRKPFKFRRAILTFVHLFKFEPIRSLYFFVLLGLKQFCRNRRCSGYRFLLCFSFYHTALYGAATTRPVSAINSTEWIFWVGNIYYGSVPVTSSWYVVVLEKVPYFAYGLQKLIYSAYPLIVTKMKKGVTIRGYFQV